MTSHNKEDMDILCDQVYEYDNYNFHMKSNEQKANQQCSLEKHLLNKKGKSSSQIEDPCWMKILKLAGLF